MLDKIIKAVKSSNKKRGRNITIGAVVGMLLSYTVVMGADDNYLWIKSDGGVIEFSTKDDGPNWEDGNPYDENSWLGNTYTNNTILSGTNNGKDLSKPIGYGLKLSGDLKEVSFINNGLILGKGKYNYGIFNSSCNIKSIINNGIIYGYYTGIGNSSDNSSSSIIGNILNNGTVFGSDFGIYNESYGYNSVSTIDNIINNGTVYSNNTGIENYTNISASSNIGNIINNGTVFGNSHAGIDNKSYGYNSVSTIKNIVNDGTIYSNYLGIDNYSDKYASSTIENIVNTGTVTRINNYSDNHALSTIGNIVNTGTVFGSSSGIDNNNNNSSSSIIGNIVNTGTVCGSDFGIHLHNEYSGPCNINNILNSGVIFGKLLYSIYNYGGTIDNIYNYGILANESSSEVVTGVDSLEKYGLIIKNGVIQGKSTNTNEGPISITIGYDDKGTPLRRNMTIKNITDPAPSSFEGNQTDSILNALTNTYKVTGKDNKVTDSIINAYGNAVFFGNNGGNLSLSGTIVNGGIKKGTVAIEGHSNNSNILILEGADVLYTDEKKRFQQTIINGDINMQNGNNTVTLKNGSVVNGSITTGEGSDTFTIENGSQINGILEGGDGKDILNFGENVIAKSTSNSDEIRIQHDISNFENINVNTNVTFFESTINNNVNEMKSLKVTGVNNLTIGKNGVLTLRIDSTNSANTHALSTGNDGRIISSTGGKLLLALNGAGNEETISFGCLTLDGSLVTKDEAGDEERITLDTTSKLHTIERVESTNNEVRVVTRWNLPDYLKYPQLNKIYHGILSIEDLIESFNVDDDEKLSSFLGYLNDIYAGSPYSYSSELSRKSAGMFRDIVTDNQFKADAGKWMIYGGLTHVDGGTKDTYYGRNSYIYDIGSSDIDADTKITGAYMLGEYGVSDTLSSGIVIGGNGMKSDLSNSSKLEGNAMYLGAFTKKYIGNLKVTAGAGFQYGDYDADRLAVNKVASDSAESVIKYSDNYNDMTYDIYLNGRYSHQVGDNLFFEPYATLSYTYIDQDGANEGNKTLAIETDSKSFDYTVGKVGVDLKKVIPHEKGKSTLSAGVSYTKILDGADEEYITGRFKGGSDFDILVAHKNEHSIGLNAKYALELENGVLFDVKGTYSIERDSHNGSGKNKTKGEWIVGTGLGYKF
ncbi:MAG: autotransporter domain-containing protein [Fusobacterium ulcerans]|uniref:autotransporter family protein n=1 Tax=Fusobacterium ulcerans TaxID=861 RepID=UPI003A8A4D84